MIATRYTITNWLKMTELKRCGPTCKCIENLRRLLVTRPTTCVEKKTLNRKIEIKEYEYENCKNRKFGS